MQNLENDGKTSLEKIRKDFEKIFGKEIVAEIAPKIESVYGDENFIDDSQNSFSIAAVEQRTREVLKTAGHNSVRDMLWGARKISRKQSSGKRRAKPLFFQEDGWRGG